MGAHAAMRGARTVEASAGVETGRVCERLNARLRGEGERERRSEREPPRGAVSSLSDRLREES